MKRLVMIFGIGALIMTLGGCNRARPIGVTQEELERRTQELMDSVQPGDLIPWKKYLAEDTLYFDEKGRNIDKAALLKEVTAMPQGYSVTIKLVQPKSRIFGDVAILSYDAQETETVFGQRMTARYHGTDTWISRDGEWKIIASQMLRYYEDPSPGRVDAK